MFYRFSNFSFHNSFKFRSSFQSNGSYSYSKERFDGNSNHKQQKEGFFKKRKFSSSSSHSGSSFSTDSSSNTYSIFRTGFSIKEMLMIGVGTVIFGGICKTLYSFLPKEEIIYSKRERPILLISPKMESLLFNSVKENYPLIPPDHAVSVLVNKVGTKLVKACGKEEFFKWEFLVVNSTEVNAFATPGGKIFINAGLFTILEEEKRDGKFENCLAAVMGHELGHSLASTKLY